MKKRSNKRLHRNEMKNNKICAYIYTHHIWYEHWCMCIYSMLTAYAKPKNKGMIYENRIFIHIAECRMHVYAVAVAVAAIAVAIFAVRECKRTFTRIYWLHCCIWCALYLFRIFRSFKCKISHSRWATCSLSPRFYSFLLLF